MDWTTEAIDQLRALWAEGHSTAEIGRRMGISKNAVVGKAHRLNLSARPSPIRRDPEAGPRPAPQPRRQAPAPRPAEVELRRLAPSPLVAASPAPAVTRAAALPAPRIAVASAPAAIVRPFPRATQRSCCWPIGEPGTPEFRFCTSEALAAKPYCPEHAAIAYVKVRERREDAA